MSNFNLRESLKKQVPLLCKCMEVHLKENNIREYERCLMSMRRLFDAIDEGGLNGVEIIANNDEQ